MKIKSLLIIGAIAAAFVTPDYAMAKPKPTKPDLSDKKEDAKEGKERPKIDREKIKERLKAAFDKRKKNHKDAKRKGQKVLQKGRAFGKLVRDDEKVKELRDSFNAAAKELLGN